MRTEDEQLAQQTTRLAQQAAQLEEKDEQLAQQAARIAILESAAATPHTPASAGQSALTQDERALLALVSAAEALLAPLEAMAAGALEAALTPLLQVRGLVPTSSDAATAADALLERCERAKEGVAVAAAALEAVGPCWHLATLTAEAKAPLAALEAAAVGATAAAESPAVATAADEAAAAEAAVAARATLQAAASAVEATLRDNEPFEARATRCCARVAHQLLCGVVGGSKLTTYVAASTCTVESA